MRNYDPLRSQNVVQFVSIFVMWLTVLAQPIEAALTNLVIANSNFEDTASGIIDDAPFESSFPQWATQNNNNFEILVQGSDTAPTTFADGTPTGQSLEVRGQRGNSNAQITLVIDVPNNPNITPGSAAELRFQAWSQDNSPLSYDNTGTVRIRVDGVDQFTSPNRVEVDSNTANTPSTVWILNTFSFNVDAGDEIRIQWRDSGNNGNAFGLRIDAVEVLVDIVPEPAHIGSFILGGIMLVSFWRKRFKIQLATR